MKILIVGGGIGGLTAGIALRQKGLEVQVFERAAALTEVGAGISLWPNAVKVLRKLGVGEKLLAVSATSGDFALRRADGRVLSVTPAQELERRFGGGVVLLHRAELLAVLAESFGGDGLHLDHACEGIEEDADGVTLRFRNGGQARGDAVIGADGLRSVVRSWLGHAARARYSGYTAWRAVVPAGALEIRPSESWGRGRRFGITQLSQGRVYWYATANAAESEYGRGEDATQVLLSLFRGWHEPVDELIRAANGRILQNDIYDHEPIAQWGRGRVTLLGDAAHAMTPNLGQGACQAMEDAEELAACLAEAAGNDAGSIAAGLRRYELARIGRTREIVMSSRRLGDIGQLESPGLCWLRDLAFRCTPSAVSMRGMAPVLGYERGR